jgi:hypothetical protein
MPPRKRAISQITNAKQPKKRRNNNTKKTKKRKSKSKKVACYCPECNGKLVERRTKLLHESRGLAVREETREETTEPIPDQISVPEIIEVELPPEIIEVELPQAEADLRGYNDRQIIDDVDDYEDQNRIITDVYSFLPRIRKRVDTNRPRIIELPQESSESVVDSEQSTETNEETNEEPSIVEIFEDYSPPPYQDLEEEEEMNNNQFSWILLWIMEFRSRFNIPETATESLIKFMKLVLSEIGGDKFNDFPDSLYLAKKELGLKDRFQSFVPCSKCHKLHRKDEVKNFRQNGTQAIMKCRHVEFPNSFNRKSNFCNTPLSQTIDNSIKPELIYPFAGIRQQLATMYRRPDFEKLLRHWADRSSSNDILADIYDGQVWKNLKETNDENSPNFFRPEVADSHLGLMLNLDWFQPYDGTPYSTGAIYAAICNLPRDIRFKRENMLLLGLLPGPDEVSLHKINHYLAPIVNELESLWSGVTLKNTHECLNGKKIKAALILVSCDIPAARKICGHVSALVSCHRCEKKANYEEGQHNFAEMSNMDEWFIARNSTQHRQDAIGWRRCNSQSSRKRFVKNTGVRWSELLRLPYFDPIKFLVVDPMHCLFLGIARSIVKKIWIKKDVLTPNILNKVQKMMDLFKVPADLGRIPRKVDCGEGFANFTADEWRNFINIYATVSLWEHLSMKDRTILTHFVRVCSILGNRIIERGLMQEAHSRLIKIVKLIEENYGRDKITSNFHLSLHLCECSNDFGPLYAFWCFTFERMNGILGNARFFFFFF